MTKVQFCCLCDKELHARNSEPSILTGRHELLLGVNIIPAIDKKKWVCVVCAKKIAEHIYPEKSMTISEHKT